MSSEKKNKKMNKVLLTVGLSVFAVIFAVASVFGFNIIRVNAAENLYNEALLNNTEIVKEAEYKGSTLDVYNNLVEPIFEYCEQGYGDENDCEQLKTNIANINKSKNIYSEIEKDEDISIKDATNSTNINTGKTVLYLTTYDAKKELANVSYVRTLNSVKNSTIDKLDESTETLKEKINNAKTVVADSEGKVEDDATRTALNEKVAAAEKLSKQPADTIDFRISLIGETKEMSSTLDTHVEKVKASVQEREDRIAREEAERIAAQNAYKNSSSNNYSNNNSYTGNSSTGYSSSNNSGGGGGSTAPAPKPSGGSTYYLNASMCGDAWNAQGCVNSYSITAIDYTPWGGPFWVGGHVGGAAGVINSFKVGDTVVVSGAGAGTYKVTGITWIPKVSGQSASSLGGGFAFQTCDGNQMRIVYATRV